MTYAEWELRGLGAETIHSARHRLVMVINDHVLEFNCAGCFGTPLTIKMGCPIHHRGPGGSWPVKRAKEALNG